MSETACNGWEGNGTRASAYATWRVMLELIDGYDFYDTYDDPPERYNLAAYIKEIAEEAVYMSVEDENAEKLATQYALAFLDNVSWEEIAENILLDWED